MRQVRGVHESREGGGVSDQEPRTGEQAASIAFGAGRLARVAAPVRGADGRRTGAVVVSTFLAPEVASAVREVNERYTKFRKTQTYREPILAFYRSLYLFPALLILFGAVQATMIIAAFWAGERPDVRGSAGMLMALGGLGYLALPGLAAPYLIVCRLAVQRIKTILEEERHPV